MHEQFLLAALEQAKLGRGQCAPNPSVGAVAVQQGKIIAQAWHRGAGTPHAEPLVLAQFPPNTPNVSLYITLEPCNHWGHTPPCVDAIIKHGISEVVFAYFDPNPIVAQNNTTAKLQSHGIKVTHCSLPVIDAFYDSYSHWIKTKMPRVTMKIAQSLDGKIAGPKGQRTPLTNELCHQLTHQLRHDSDVILTTANTINNDNPLMNVRLKGTTIAKPVAIIDSQLQLNHQSAIFSTANHCHVYYQADSAEAAKHLNADKWPNCTYHPMPTQDGKIDLYEVIKNLGEIGYHDVFVEAGGKLFTTLHQRGLVHRTYIYIAPKVLGADALSAYQDSSIFERPHTISWISQGDNMVACIEWRER